MEVLPRELLVLPDVRRDHPAQPLGHQQPAQPPVVDPAVVGHRLEVGGLALEQRLDQHRRDPAQTETSDRERRTARDVGHRLGGTRHDLVHAWFLPRPVGLSGADRCPGAASRAILATGARDDRVADARTLRYVSDRKPDWPRVRLHVVTGKGGTGKSTVAAALALALASKGKHVLLCEVEGRQGIARMFDVDPLPYEERRIATGLPDADGAHGHVHALHIDAESALLEYLAMYYKLGRAGRALDRFGVIEFATTIAPGRPRRPAHRQGVRGRAAQRPQQEGHPVRRRRARRPADRPDHPVPQREQRARRAGQGRARSRARPTP